MQIKEAIMMIHIYQGDEDCRMDLFRKYILEQWNFVYLAILVLMSFDWIIEVCRLVNHEIMKQFSVSRFFQSADY